MKFSTESPRWNSLIQSFKILHLYGRHNSRVGAVKAFSWCPLKKQPNKRTLLECSCLRDMYPIVGICISSLACSSSKCHTLICGCYIVDRMLILPAITTHSAGEVIVYIFATDRWMSSPRCFRNSCWIYHRKGVHDYLQFSHVETCQKWLCNKLYNISNLNFVKIQKNSCQGSEIMWIIYLHGFPDRLKKVSELISVESWSGWPNENGED